MGADLGVLKCPSGTAVNVFEELVSSRRPYLPQKMIALEGTGTGMSMIGESGYRVFQGAALPMLVPRNIESLHLHDLNVPSSQRSQCKSHLWVGPIICRYV